MKKPLKLIAAIMSILLIPAIFAACSSNEQPKPVFSLDKTSVELTVGGNVEVLTLSVANVNEQIEWASSDTSIATVSVGTSANKATVRGVDAGAAVITATAGNRVAICAVTVNPGLYINLDKTSINLRVGRTAAIWADTNVTTGLTYTSDNPLVARVDKTGLITGVSGGTAIITVSGGNKTATCFVTVTEPYVNLNKELVLLTLKENENTFQLEADSNGEVEWDSDDPEIATVDDKGLVTAVAEGETRITAVYESAIAECVVKVKEEILTVTIYNDGEEAKDALTLKSGESLTLSATVTPEQTGNDALVTWSLKSGEGIVSVNKNGVVTSIGGEGNYGNAVIVATSVKDPDCTAECKITVPDPYAGWLEISDKASLEAALKSGNEKKSMRLMGDIDLDGATINSTIGKFNATFEGNGYEIMNFTCNRFFGGIDVYGKVTGLALTCTVGRSGGEYNGGLFGEFILGKVENCRFDVTVNDNNMSAVSHHIGDSGEVNNVILLVRNPLNKAQVHAGCFLNRAWQNSYCAVEGNVVSVQGPTQKTEAELKQASLYAGWDEAVWQIEDGEIPVLKNGGNIGELRVVLNTEAETVYKGEFFDLVATVKPVKLPAADRAVIWTSSNESVATVDENGSVTALEEGTAVITATSVKDSTKFASCTITVELPDTNPEPVLEITNKSATSDGLKIGNSLTLNIRKNRDDGTLSWTSSDNGIATVENGTVTAIGEGEVTITATFLTDNGKSATDSVTINVYGDGYIELALSARSVSIGGTYKIDHKALGGSVSWTSSNTSVATVDASGVVSGVSAGKTVITAKVGEKTETMVIQVYEKAAGFIEISTVEQFLGIDGANKYYIVNDLDFAGKEYEQNTFNTLVAVIRGNGYSIKNLTINLSGTDVGFIDQMGNGFDMQDVNFTNMTIKGDAIHGGFVKLMVGNASVSNCYFQVNMEARGIRIGVIGMMDGSSSLSNCIFDVNYGTGALSGSANANPRAIVGRKYNGTVENCYANQTTLGSAAGKVFAISSGDGNSDLEASAFKTEAQLKSASTFDESWEMSWVIINGEMPKLKGALVTEPLKIKLDKTSVELFVGENETLSATVTPSELTEEERAINWVSDDPTIATVVNGVVTAKKAGSVTIKAVSVKDETVFAACTVTVKAIEISINAEDKITELKLNGTKQLNATVNCGEYTWESDKLSVATVTENGLVEAVGAGEVTIIVRSKNDPTKYDSITIQVKATVQITVELSSTTLSLDRDATATITATVVNSDNGVTWTSSDTSVATVDENGKVTTQGKDGSATITATSVDDKGDGTHATATCVVTVKFVPVEITLNNTSYNIFVGATLSLSEIAEVNKGNLELSVVNGDGVVSVEDGIITATGAGSATVRLTSTISYSDKTAVYKEIAVSVVKAQVKISIDSTRSSLKVGESSAANLLKVTLDNMPASPAASDIVWTSSNETAATVAGGYSSGAYTGQLTVKSAGKSTITATYTLDGVDYKVTCEVNAFTAEGNWTAVYNLATFKSVWNNGGGNYYLVHDLDLNGEAVNMQRQDYNAVFNGHGYTVSNFVTNHLFYYNNSGSVIENVKFVCTLYGNGNNEGVLGHHGNGGTIRNCYLDITFGENCSGVSPALANHLNGMVIENTLVVTHNPNNKTTTYADFCEGGTVTSLISCADSNVTITPKVGAVKTEAELKTASTFEGWTAWVAVDGEYPRLAGDWEA